MHDRQYLSNALCDLGANINLVPSFIFQKLKIKKVKSIIVSLQLVDCLVKYHKGIIEDAFVKVYKFMFSTNLSVVDMEVDHEVPLIFKRPFLPIRGSLINVYNGHLIVRMQDKQVPNNMVNVMKYPKEEVDSDEKVMDYTVVVLEKNCSSNDPLEACLVQSVWRSNLRLRN